MQRCRKATGFTLMEMLIVVAIIAVLIAIAIPIFTSQLASARVATCQANQRSLLGSFETIYMSDVDSPLDDQMTKAVASMGSSVEVTGKDGAYTVTGLCSEDGTWTCIVQDGILNTTCSVPEHNKTSKSFSQTGTMQAINDVMKEIADGHSVHNTGTNLAPQIKEALAKQGIDLDKMGAASWYWRNGSGPYDNKLYWTATAVPTTGTGTMLAMSYNFKSKNYVVWEMNYSDGKLTGERGSHVGPEDGEQNYEKAFALYQEKLKEQG